MMELHFYPWIHYPLFIGSILCLMLAVTAWRRRRVPGAVPASLMMLAAASWNIGSFFEHASSTLGEKLFWTNVQYPGTAFIALLWFVLVLQYFDYRVLTRRFILVASIIPVCAVVMNWTNGLHHLYYTRWWMASTHGMPYIVLAHGWPFWIFIAYSCALYLSGLLLCGYAIMQAFPVYRRQMVIMLCAAIIPCLLNVMYLCRLGPIPTLDFTPLAFPLSGMLVIWGLRRYELWKLTPVAHRMIVESMKDGVLVLDPDGHILEVNPAASQLLHLPIPALVNQPVTAVAPWVPWTPTVADAGETVTTVTITTDPLYVCDIYIIPLLRQDQFHTGDLIHLRDVTEHHRAEAALQEMAYYDALTGLPNRRGAIERLKQALVRGRRQNTRTTVLYLDLDEFKHVTDTWGHSVGDVVLQEASRRLVRCVRASDAVARLGGDEFLIILPDQAANAMLRQQLEITVERILAAFSDPMVIGDISVLLTPSIGMATAPDDGDAISLLLERADLAMYAAKRGGRNTYQYYASITSHL
ncbi:MAG TPA: histidine kinase N-terminal 7TM domain-containing protein [Armatimonadota bacterium]|nr:histidine kinase N-terminal 7TM domain-containing protein [Armatimonadota bacterium]